MAPEKIKIDEVEYVRKDLSTAGDIKIVVLDRGFVYVGRIDLGELVSGPLADTKLDAVGTVRAPLRTLIFLIDVNQEKWNCI